MEREGVRERERNQWEAATDKGKAYKSAYWLGVVASNDPHVAEYVITVVTLLILVASI